MRRCCAIPKGIALPICNNLKHHNFYSVTGYFKFRVFRVFRGQCFSIFRWNPIKILTD